jgi:integrase
MRQYIYWLTRYGEFLDFAKCEITFESMKKFASETPNERRTFYFLFVIIKKYYDFTKQDFSSIDIEFKKIRKGKRYVDYIPVTFDMSEDELKQLMEGVKYNYHKSSIGTRFVSVKTDMSQSEREKYVLSIELLYYTGMRISELLLLTKDDIGKGSPLPISIPAEITKTEKGRIIYIPKDDLAQKLVNYKGNGKYLFVFTEMKQQTKTIENVQHETMLLDARLKKFAKEAGLLADKFKHISCHKFRHAYSHYLKSKGFSLEDRMKAMGHSSTDMTSKYSLPSDEGLKKKFKKLVDTGSFGEKMESE